MDFHTKMPLFNLKSLGKFYRIRVKCSNCGEIQELNIPKGNTVKSYMEDERAVCSSCGCNTLQIKKGDKNEKTPSI